MFTFLYTLYFLLLIPIIFFIILLYFKWNKKILFWDISILEKVFTKNTLFYKWYFIILLFIFFLFIWLLANPIKQETLEKSILYQPVKKIAPMIFPSIIKDIEEEADTKTI